MNKDKDREKRKEGIARKIEKLLALADPERNPSEAQVAAALKKAQELAMKHDLELSRLQEESFSADEIEEGFLWETGRPMTPWKKTLLGISCKLYQCMNLRKRGVGHKYEGGGRWRTSRRVIRYFIMGRPDDIRMATMTYTYLLDVCARNVRREYQEAKALGKERAFSHNSWSHGFADRIMERVTRELREHETASQEWGLVRVKKDGALTDYMKSKGYVGLNRPSKCRIRKSSYDRGREVGGRVDYRSPGRPRITTKGRLLTCG